MIFPALLANPAEVAADLPDDAIRRPTTLQFEHQPPSGQRLKPEQIGRVDRRDLAGDTPGRALRAAAATTPLRANGCLVLRRSPGRPARRGCTADVLSAGVLRGAPDGDTRGGRARHPEYNRARRVQERAAAKKEGGAVAPSRAPRPLDDSPGISRKTSSRSRSAASPNSISSPRPRTSSSSAHPASARPASPRACAPQPPATPVPHRAELTALPARPAELTPTASVTVTSSGCRRGSPSPAPLVL